MIKEFKRVAIINRGEAAVRAINAIQEFNQEYDTNIRTIALYTEPDSHALFVRQADETVDLGPSIREDTQGNRVLAYQDLELLERVLLDCKADAAWVGWGFVSEKPDFVDLCEQMKITFIGPNAELMRKLGDKISCKRTAQAAGVPVVPWSDGPVDNLEQARQHADRIGFPLMIKASAGDGGRGITRVENNTELEMAFLATQHEAQKKFGSNVVYMEKLIPNARHLEVQLLGDQHGTIWAISVRDCSVQRLNRKIIEESPSPVLTSEQDDQLRELAIKLAKSVNYFSAGTAEFLYDQSTKECRLIEFNTRLQLEHPVSELTSGVDLVKLQLAIAMGQKLEGEPPGKTGHAIEVRLYAEDTSLGFAPAPGRIELLRTPKGAGLRVDTGVIEGDRIPAEYSLMMAKIMAHGRDRKEALSRLRRALSQTTVVIQGGTSNKGFLLEVLGRKELEENQLDVTWLDALVKQGAHLVRPYRNVALVMAAIEAYMSEARIERVQFFTAAHHGRPEVRKESGYQVKLDLHNHTYTFHVFRVGTHHFNVHLDGQLFEVVADSMGESEWRLEVNHHNYRVFSVMQGYAHQAKGTGLSQRGFVFSSVQGHVHLVEVNGVPHRITHHQGGIVRSPAPAVVVSINVVEGDEIKVGDRLAVVEAMKTEMSVFAAFPGKVKQILVRSNVQVGTGTPLMIIETPKATGETYQTDRVEFTEMVSKTDSILDVRELCQRTSAELSSLMRGFDLEPTELTRIMANRQEICMKLPVNDPGLLQGEEKVLTIFADIIALFKREPTEEELDLAGRFSSKEYLFAFLRDPHAQGEGLPPTFINKLKKALAHYNVNSLVESEALQMNLFRICKAYQRMEGQLTPIYNILERSLENAEELLNHVSDDFRVLLQRISRETLNRFPTLHDLVNEVHYVFFERPLLEESRTRAYREVQDSLAKLEENPRSENREELILSMVNCPQPLKVHLMRRHRTASPELRQAILEIMTRRYYRIRQLTNINTTSMNGNPLVSAQYDLQGRHLQLFAVQSKLNDLQTTATSLIEELKRISDETDVLIDFILTTDTLNEDQETTQKTFAQQLNQINWPRQIRRIVVAVSGHKQGEGMDAVLHYTYRPSSEGYVEEALYRNLHPMMGKRMRLWRLDNFEIERLPSLQDVYLFKGVARDNPRDSRLFAFAEVRDMTVVRRNDGKELHIPMLERMLLESLAAIRRYQYKQDERKRMHWNRVVLYVWPTMEVSPGEFRSLVHRLAPATAGLGLEKVVVRTPLFDPSTGETKEMVLDISSPAGGGVVILTREPAEEPIKPLSKYEEKVVRLRNRGLIYPYELIRLLTPEQNNTDSNFPPGKFQEYDLDENNELVPVNRPYGGNKCNIIVGVITSYTEKYPEGMSRVILLGDPSRGMGNLSEPECRRINAGMYLAEQLGIPLEWFAVSAGALISMESGTENMDWISLVLRRIIEFTQRGGIIHVVVVGINVGAQPYWNAEATMLMHTKGILIMTPEGTMVLTGKRALDFSGGVSAEDNHGIGGYEHVMGPNGQAQYFARDLGEACRMLMKYYDHSYVLKGERFPRKAPTKDPINRDVCAFPHGGEFKTVGEIFSNETNPGRKRPFEIRKVMRAVMDQDHEPLERWFGMRDAEIAVIWDAHVGGIPVQLMGFESRPLDRLGYVPNDGPKQWTSGTLFPMASKKIARSINSASGNRPLLVVANLSGFDGSPESMMRTQLEFGAEIGRAVTNFQGPIVFCVVSRYHGGAFVVFSNALQDNMEVIALEGTYASVIGGSPAAAVVFAREVDKRTKADERLQTLEAQIKAAKAGDKAKLREQYNSLFAQLHSENLGKVADEFDTVHSVERAQRMGSVNNIIPAKQMRPYIIEALERGMKRTLGVEGIPEIKRIME